ncbi:hypothetical protein Ahy_B07g086511 [Arachis hypogaea]|uniref:Protein FAR1-RELATED SEQUENCE n=1 Tax=Arachis hypogaea TaxID=3818 RepID=A0A444Y9Y9_ARAHY|nr:hypothetical protein Ahy_B07g086511 [Arachis hypogaea]
MFRDVQTEFMKKADCRVPVIVEEGGREKLVNDTILCIPYDIYFDRSTQEVRYECNLFEISVFHMYKVYKVPTCYVLPRWSKNIKRKHTYIKSSHDVSWSDKGLYAYFFNITQEFVNDDDKTALLHAALEETRSKLTEHRAKKKSMGSSSVVGLDNIQGPSKITTKGQPKSNRLGAVLEKSFKKSARRKNKNVASIYVYVNLTLHDYLVVRSEGSENIEFVAPVGRNEPQQFGRFMSLLRSFGNS